MGTLNVNRPSGIQSIPGYSRRASFSIPIANATPTGANYILACIEAGPNSIVKIRRINFLNPGSATVAQKTLFDMVRTTAPSTGGALYVPNAYDGVTTRTFPFSGIIRTGNPSITTTGNPLQIASAYTPGALAGFVSLVIDWQSEILMPPTITNGINNGFALRCTNGAATLAGVDLQIDFTEEEY